MTQETMEEIEAWRKMVREAMAEELREPVPVKPEVHEETEEDL